MVPVREDTDVETNSFLTEEELVDIRLVVKQSFPVEATLFNAIRDRQSECGWRTIIAYAREARVEILMAETEERPATNPNILLEWTPFPFPLASDPHCPQEVPPHWDQLWSCFTSSSKQVHREIAMRRILGFAVNESIVRLVVSRHAIEALRQVVKDRRLCKIDPGMWAFMVYYAPRFYVDTHNDRLKERDKMKDMVLAQILVSRVAPRVSREALVSSSNFFGFVYSSKLANVDVKLDSFDEWFEDVWSRYKSRDLSKLRGADLAEPFQPHHWEIAERYARAKSRAVYDKWDSIQERSRWRTSIDSWVDAMVPSNDPQGPARNVYGLFPEEPLGPVGWPIRMAGVDSTKVVDQYDTRKLKVLYVARPILDQSGYPNQFLRFARFCEYKSALPRSPGNRFAWDKENTVEPGTLETRGRGQPIDIGVEGSLASREKHYEAFAAMLSRVLIRAANICMSEHARIRMLVDLAVQPSWYEDIPQLGSTPDRRRAPPLLTISKCWLELADQLRNDAEHRIPIGTRVPIEEESKYPKNTLRFQEIALGDFPRPQTVPPEVWAYAENQVAVGNPLAVLFLDAVDAVVSASKDYNKEGLGYVDFRRAYTRKDFQSEEPYDRRLLEMVQVENYLVPARQREGRNTRLSSRARTPKVDTNSLFDDFLQWEEIAWKEGKLRRPGWKSIRLHASCQTIDPEASAVGALPLHLRRHRYTALGLWHDELLEPLGSVSEPPVGRVIFVTDGLAKYVASVAENSWLLTLPFTQLRKMIEVVRDPTTPLSIREGCRFYPCPNDIFVFVYGSDRIFETDYSRTFDRVGSPIFRPEGKRHFLCPDEDVSAFKRFREDFPLTFLALPLVSDRRVQPFQYPAAEQCLKLNNEFWRSALPKDAILDPNDLGEVPPSIDRKLDVKRGPRDDVEIPPGSWKESMDKNPLRDASSRGMAEIYLNPRGSRGYFQILMWKLEVASRRPSGCLFWRGVGGNQFPRVFLGAYPHNNRYNSPAEPEPVWMFPTSLACNSQLVLPSGKWLLLGDNALHDDHLAVTYDEEAM